MLSIAAESVRGNLMPATAIQAENTTAHVGLHTYAQTDGHPQNIVLSATLAEMDTGYGVLSVGQGGPTDFTFNRFHMKLFLNPLSYRLTTATRTCGKTFLANVLKKFGTVYLQLL